VGLIPASTGGYVESISKRRQILASLPPFVNSVRDWNLSEN
jgi:hypothetical protein